MRLVLQRVSRASVTMESGVTRAIGAGICLLVGIAEGDTPADVSAAAEKLLGLRVFPDREGKMNQSIVDTGGEILLVSQFTLLADVRRGRRPSFTAAAAPAEAEDLLQKMVSELRNAGAVVRSGDFGAKMAVELVNDGPVTIVVDINDGRVS